MEKTGFYSIKPGVYVSNNIMLEKITLIVLNELPNTPNNLYWQCFASHAKVREEAFKLLWELKLPQWNEADIQRAQVKKCYLP